MEEGVLGESNGALIVAIQQRSVGLRISKVIEEFSKPYDVLSGFISCSVFSFCRGGSHGGLLSCTPADAAASDEVAVAGS